MREFLTWVAAAERTYEDAMEAWRTSCPRLSVWEDASIAGLIALQRAGGTTYVTLTNQGKAIIGAVRADA